MQVSNSPRVSAQLESFKQLRKLEGQSPNDFRLAGSVESVCDDLACILLQLDRPFSESLCSKEFAETVWKVLIEAARHELDIDFLSQIIGDSTISRGILSAYKAHGEKLRDLLPTIGWEHPKVVGIDWSILSVVESSADVEIEEPLVEITFKILPTCETSTSSFKFLCNKNELQDLQWKVKEAYNMLQKASQK